MSYYGSEAFPELSLIDLSLEQLVESDFHLGSKLNRFEKLNFKYVFSRRFDVMIVDLTYSLYNLRLAVFFLSVVVSRRGKVLFFDNHESTQNFVRFIGVTAKQYYISRKWIAGLLTNFKNFYPAVFSGMARHFRFSESRYAGMRFIHRPPNVTCLLNTTRGSSAFLENFRLAIPTVALVNLDNEISGVTFPIYSNNDSIYTHYTFFSVLRAAVLNGYRDEIYKFYRRSIKRRLFVRHKRLLAMSYFKAAVSFFLRQYLLRFILLNKELVYGFFAFVNHQMHVRTEGASNFVAQLINLFIRDIVYLIGEKTLGSLSLRSNSSAFKKLVSSSDSEMSFYFKILYVGVDFLFGPNSVRFFWLFGNRFFLPLQVLFWMFMNSDLSYCGVNDATKIKRKFSQFYIDLRVIRLIFNMWLSTGKGAVSKVEFRQHFLYEFMPMFDCGRGFNDNDLRAPLSAKLFNFRMQYSGYLPYIRFLNFNMLASWHKEFRTGHPFKALKFSRAFKSMFRMISKRIRFAKFLWRALYPRRNPFLYFDLAKGNNVILSRSFVVANKSRDFFTRRYTAGATVKNLTRRRLVRDRFNAAMLQYFDEEFDDYPFPVNNEFFFLHAAYGSIFLTRQYHRNKLLIAQRELMHKSADMYKGPSSSSQRLHITLRNNRIMLYFAFSKDLFKVKH